jgi:hypothetical protein
MCEADCNDCVMCEDGGLDYSLTIYISTIRAALVGDHVYILNALDHGMFARNLTIIQLNIIG